MSKQNIPRFDSKAALIKYLVLGEVLSRREEIGPLARIWVARSKKRVATNASSASQKDSGQQQD